MVALNSLSLLFLPSGIKTEKKKKKEKNKNLFASFEKERKGRATS